MERFEAIKWIKDIQSGSGVDSSKFPEELKGKMAKRYWYEGEFSYGMEYGIIFALLEVFDLTLHDLGKGDAAGRAYRS